MSDIEFIEVDEDNTYKRLPVALCLDTSGSMASDIGELNRSVAAFFSELQGHDKAKDAVETVVVEFGNGADRGVSVVTPFTEIGNVQAPVLSAGGGTPMGKALEKCLELLSERKQNYKEASIDYYQPVLVLMTDGQPTDSVDEARTLIREQVSNSRLVVIPVAIGLDADRRVIEDITGREPIFFNDKSHFLEFFKWLSMSAAAPGNIEEDLDDFLAGLDD